MIFPERNDTRPVAGFAEALQSSVYAEAERRIFRQLIEALIYEGVICPETELTGDGQERYTIKGKAESGEPVAYVCEGRKRLSFRRVRISGKRVSRLQGKEERDVDDVALFLYEISPFMTEKAGCLSSFVRELEQTLLKDTMARYYRFLQGNRNLPPGYDHLEAGYMDGHPYHPCYKSRVGFDLADNEAYGPDFNPGFKLLWIAVRNEDIEVSSMSGINYRDFLTEEIGDIQSGEFAEKLKGRGLRPEDYTFVPVHPWQWREKAAGIFFRRISEERIVLLGEGADYYTPQQSVRTLSNMSVPRKANVKLSLHMVNTSSIRSLSPRHVRNGPVVSGWLDGIWKQDVFLRDEQRLVLLKETAGISFRYELLSDPVQPDASGSLGVIWRESIHEYLESEEEAVPFTVLCLINADGRPYIDPWVKQTGIEVWYKRLLTVTLEPLLHLLYAYGAAVESHAQNLVLIHRGGVPGRLAVKDFSGGVLFYKGEHANPESFPETGIQSEVRDVVHNALFFIHLSQLALFLEEHYGVEEASFWQNVAETIRSYQSRFPSLTAQFQQYDLFEERVEVGQLAKRRLMGNTDHYDHIVPNVLYHFAQA